MALFRNNVRIFGGEIKSRTANPLHIGSEKEDEKVTTLYTKHLQVTGEVEIPVTLLEVCVETSVALLEVALKYR